MLDMVFKTCVQGTERKLGICVGAVLLTTLHLTHDGMKGFTKVARAARVLPAGHDTQASFVLSKAGLGSERLLSETAKLLAD